MLGIQKKFIRYNFSNAPGRVINYIVIHDVGSVSTAENNYEYFNGGNRNASADFFVDPSNIMQFTDYKNSYSWHCGDGGGKFGISNRNSIGIEMCLVEPFETTLKNTIDLVKYLMKELNIPIERVVRHYDASRKLCPKTLSANNWEKWNWFKNQLIKEDAKVKNLVVFGNDVDRRAAEYLADYLQCATLHGDIPYDYSNIENVYCVGGPPPEKGWTSYAKYKIAGPDRYETIKEVLKHIGRL